jgi:hypothetical protein
VLRALAKCQVLLSKPSLCLGLSARLFHSILRLASALAKRLCRAFQIGQHFIGMPFGLHVVKDVGNLAIRADHKCGASDSFHLSAIHVLFFDHTKGFADLLVGVGQQGIG